MNAHSRIPAINNDISKYTRFFLDKFLKFIQRILSQNNLKNQRKNSTHLLPLALGMELANTREAFSFPEEGRRQTKNVILKA